MELLSRRPLLESLPRPPGRLTGYIGASTYFTSNLTGGSLDSHWHPVASFADARLCQTWHQLCRLGVTQWPSLHFHNMTQPSPCKTITRESKEARLSNANMTAAPFPPTASALKGWPKSAGCGSYDGAAVCASPVCTGGSCLPEAHYQQIQHGSRLLCWKARALEMAKRLSRPSSWQAAHGQTPHRPPSRCWRQCGFPRSLIIPFSLHLTNVYLFVFVHFSWKYLNIDWSRRRQQPNWFWAYSKIIHF